MLMDGQETSIFKLLIPEVPSHGVLLNHSHQEKRSLCVNSTVICRVAGTPSNAVLLKIIYPGVNYGIVLNWQAFIFLGVCGFCQSCPNHSE